MRLIYVICFILIINFVLGASPSSLGKYTPVQIKELNRLKKELEEQNDQLKKEEERMKNGISELEASEKIKDTGKLATAINFLNVLTFVKVGGLGTAINGVISLIRNRKSREARAKLGELLTNTRNRIDGNQRAIKNYEKQLSESEGNILSNYVVQPGQNGKNNGFTLNRSPTVTRRKV